jgi:hypothetical protein
MLLLSIVFCMIYRSINACDHTIINKNHTIRRKKVCHKVKFLGIHVQSFDQLIETEPMREWACFDLVGIELHTISFERGYSTRAWNTRSIIASSSIVTIATNPERVS